MVSYCCPGGGHDLHEVVVVKYCDLRNSFWEDSFQLFVKREVVIGKRRKIFGHNHTFRMEFNGDFHDASKRKRLKWLPHSHQKL